MRITKPEILPFEAIKYLEMGLEETPASLETIETIADAINKGIGEVYCLEDDRIYAAMYSVVLPNPKGGKPYFNIALLAGDEMKLWQPVLAEFLKEISNTHTVLAIGRKGWLKFIPGTKEIGTICTLG